MKQPLLQTETRVRRTYRGGSAIDAFLGKADPADSFYPEDWISSFTEAKNKDYIPGEGISRVVVGGVEMPISQAVQGDDFGPGRTQCGVLVKLLDAGERLGIQVHPTPAFAMAHFGTPHGKTECWHILAARPGAAVYIGFRPGITREVWQRLFAAQDVAGMLACLHRIPVQAGDTVLVRAGTPHAIGQGCFLLEIQEPTDYTMRMETTTVAGERLTPMQIHYGAGEEALFDCFAYEGLTEAQARERFFLPAKPGGFGACPQMLVTYADTPCFALGKLRGGEAIAPDSFVTLVMTAPGALRVGQQTLQVRRGDKLFVPYGCGQIACQAGEAIVCYPPQI